MVSPVMDGDTDQLGRAVRELADRAEINDLVSHLGRWLDEKRFDDTRSVFTEDAIGEFPSGPIRGVEALTDQARRHHADFERTQHITTNTLVDLAGDRATVRANLIATFVRHADTPEPEPTVGERYRFEAVRTEQGWRFCRVEVHPVWRSTAPNR
ncbi:MAG TPA: nuclear transport factor 2 family protein [Mycobacteriales bacterium]